MTGFQLVVRLQADLDIAEAMAWYEARQQGLGGAFLDQLRATYDRIVDTPHGYATLRGDIRRALMRQFPYGVYFVVEDEPQVAVVIAVLHLRRHPSTWQARDV